MNYYLLGTVIVFVFFGTLSYVVSILDSKDESVEQPVENLGIVAEELYPADVSGSLPISNGGFDIAQYPVDCPKCDGPCKFGPVPMSTDEFNPDFATFGDSLKPAKKAKKKSVKKPTKKTKKSKKTKKVKSLLEQMFEDAPKDKKSKKPSKKKK